MMTCWTWMISMSTELFQLYACFYGPDAGSPNLGIPGKLSRYMLLENVGEMILQRLKCLMVDHG